MVEKPGSGTAAGQGLLQGFFDQRCFEGVTGSPTDDLTAVEIHDRGQVKPTVHCCEDVSDIAYPNAIGSFGQWPIRKQIAGNGIRVIGVSGFRPESSLLAGFELKGAHMTGDAVTTAGDALVLKANSQSRTAIGPAISHKQL